MAAGIGVNDAAVASLRGTAFPRSPQSPERQEAGNHATDSAPALRLSLGLDTTAADLGRAADVIAAADATLTGSVRPVVRSGGSDHSTTRVPAVRAHLAV